MNISTALALTAPLTAAAARPLARWVQSLSAAMGKGQARRAPASSIAHRLPQGQTLVIDKPLDQLVMCHERLCLDHLRQRPHGPHRGGR
jgi:hypothetical protein